MPDIPRQPSGSDSEYVFHQNNHHELYSGKREIVSGPGVRVSKTTRGRKTQFIGRPGRAGKPAEIMVFRGEWLAEPPDPYMKQHMVKVSGGVSSGTFISVADNNASVPSAGSQDWIQIASGDALGFWS